ncbi:MAG TPA: AMP-binding protein, partial [Pyrinomonadaceae bacterium]|nr:AMP-binding protein [Pyrinomonadaceae bacterium]
NTLVLRTNLSGDPTFTELLARVREVCLGAYAHQDVPFEMLVEELQPERDRSRTPLFQVTFALEHEPLPDADVAGMRWSAGAIETGGAKFDLTLELTETDAGLAGLLQYNTDIFDAATIARMAAHFETLVAGIAADPTARISTLPLLTPAEHEQLLGAWNETAAPYPRELCLHQIFARQAAATPEAVAVIFGDEQLTYAELNQRANQLAHRLRRLGVRPEVRVGVLMERSLELVVVLLGIMKAGGAYVPLDPAYPQDRLAYMLADSSVSVLVAQDELRARVPVCAAHVLSLAAEAAQLATEDAHDLDVPATPEQLIYVIYTSGSTGRPKGVMLPHRGVVNCLWWLESMFHLDAQDRVLVKASLSFDASVWELFWPLLVGASAVLARPGGQQDSAYLAAEIARRRVTTVHFVPSMLPVFLDEKAVG